MEQIILPQDILLETPASLAGKIPSPAQERGLTFGPNSALVHNHEEFGHGDAESPPGGRIGCGACGEERPPGSRYLPSKGMGQKPNRATWVAMEKLLASHGGVVIPDVENDDDE